ncbi:hypothetical protein QYE76_050152 [Lolium multiflorum]|uniref:Uncharacterized protein n=1 Tax=Lolium multiflorum TaxID=4521 RepID=A0AAD8SPC1_LOLMU|nr:hypothetical protein QYE76_050152 [Lolium multiflorum]
MEGGSVEDDAWYLDMEDRLDKPLAETEQARWMARCIYRVPACVKDIKSKAYTPQVVSLGPFHHGDPDLLSMEEHKLRAVRHVVRRAGITARGLVAAVGEVAEHLECSYMDLGGEGRGPRTWGRRSFVQMMVADGCFLLEVMRTDAGNQVGDYAPNDPIFSGHGLLYTGPNIRRDMLMIENQLPLLLLKTITTVEGGNSSSDAFINSMVLRFLSQCSPTPPTEGGLCLHPLDALRRSMLFRPYHVAYRNRNHKDAQKSDIIGSARELYEAGIHFKKSNTNCLDDISFVHGVLSLPQVSMHDSIEVMLLNMMAFERLHVGAGHGVTAYVAFLYNIIDKVSDVALLRSKGIIQSAIGSDKAMAILFNRISRDTVIEPGSALDAVQREVSGYYRNNCRRVLNGWWINLVDKYFQNPWTIISLLAAVVLVTLAVLQTVYTMLSFYEHQDN